MGLGYVGYIWSILGCAFVTLFVGGLGVALYVIGKRAERARPRTFVESVSSSVPSAPIPPSTPTSSDDAA